MTLGYVGWCSSNWHTVYYRVWKVDSLTVQSLLEKAEMRWLRTETFLVGSIGQRTGNRNSHVVDVLIEFTQASVDPAVHNREAVRHYLIEGDRVRRVDPVALGPRDFVDKS